MQQTLTELYIRSKDPIMDLGWWLSDHNDPIADENLLSVWLGAPSKNFHFT